MQKKKNTGQTFFASHSFYYEFSWFLGFMKTVQLLFKLSKFVSTKLIQAVEVLIHKYYSNHITSAERYGKVLTSMLQNEVPLFLRYKLKIRDTWFRKKGQLNVYTTLSKYCQYSHIDFKSFILQKNVQRKMLRRPRSN